MSATPSCATASSCIVFDRHHSLLPRHAWAREEDIDQPEPWGYRPKTNWRFCFAHRAYNFQPRFEKRQTGIRCFRVWNRDELDSAFGEAAVLVISGLWRDKLADLMDPLPAASPLWGLSNTFITPHTAGETRRYEDNVLDILEENLERLWQGESNLRNQIV